MSETGDKVVSDEERVRAALPDAKLISQPITTDDNYEGIGYMVVWVGLSHLHKLWVGTPQCAWAVALRHPRVVAFEAQHRPASQLTHPCDFCSLDCRCTLSENHCWHECPPCDCKHEASDHEPYGRLHECGKCSCARYTSEPASQPLAVEPQEELFPEFWAGFGKRMEAAGDSPEVIARTAWHAAKAGKTLNRDEVLYAFHIAYVKPAAQNIIDWCTNYPQFAEDIRSHAAVAWDWASIKPEAPEGAKEEFLIPEFIQAMNDIGRYGHEKYGEESFQHRRTIGDTSRRLERCSPKEIMDHAHNHFQLHISGVPHDKFHTYRHQLAAVAFNAMMEYYFSSKEPVISVREAGK